jgi:hypothetical protein
MLFLIVMCSVSVRIVINWNAPGPWIFVDELIYSSLGRTSLSGFTIRGVHISGYGSVYPLLLSPAYYLFDNLVLANQAVKVTNAFVMSLAAIPVYFAARTLMRRRWSLAAAALAVLVPGMSYTSVVMTENAFYPVFATAVMCMLFALLGRRLVWQLAVFPAVFVAFETRAQGAALIAVYGIALIAVVATDAVAAPAGARLKGAAAGVRRFWLSILILVGGLTAVLVYSAAVGRSLSSMLGAYAVTAEATDRYQWRPIVSWFLMHMSELDLWLGVIPFVALLVLIGAATCRSADRNLRVFACLAVTTIVVFGVVVAAFVVFSNVGRIEERNLFYVGIFPLMALCWWLNSDLPRQPRWFVIVVAVASALPLAIPFGALINQTAASDTFGLYLPWAIQNRLLDVTLTTYAIAAGIIAAAVLLVLARGRSRFLLVAAVSLFFLLTGYAVQVKTDKASAGAVAQGIGGERDWIDHAVGGDAEVTVMYSGALEPLRVWENEFFNRSIKGVYAMGVPVPDGLPQSVVHPNESGRIVDLADNPVAASLVMVHDSTVVAGTTVAADSDARLSIIRAAKPLRLLRQTLGLYDDGWTSGEVVFRVYECSGGTVRVDVRLDGFLHADPVTVTPRAGDELRPAVTVPVDGTVVTIAVPVNATPAHVCEVSFSVAPLAVPQEILGSADPRPLGVLMTQPVLQP